ncbi:MAG: hypothetical protein U0441_00935 [Polyangiaceae bacterium]
MAIFYPANAHGQNFCAAPSHLRRHDERGRNLRIGVAINTLVVGVVSGAASLGFGALTIGLEVDRASMARGHAGNTCAGANGATAFCTELRERRDQRDAATGLAVGFGALAGAAVLTALLSGRSGRDSGPRVAPLVSADGAGVSYEGRF